MENHGRRSSTFPPKKSGGQATAGRSMSQSLLAATADNQRSKGLLQQRAGTKSYQILQYPHTFFLALKDYMGVT